jgi:hypothetical protein
MFLTLYLNKKHMKNLKSLILILAASFHSIILFGQTDSIRAVHVGLVYPVSSNGLKAADYTNRFSLHAIGGISKNERALALSGVANVVRLDANGTVISGAVNVIGHDARGVQLAGFSNITKNRASGTQVSGFLNLSGSASGVQIAGFSNIVMGNSQGLQLSGFMNKSQDVNMQISGFMNIAKKVKGVQLAGLINVADSSDYPIALLNFIKSGEKSISVTIDETMTGLASFRSGGRFLYGIIGVGYNFRDTDKSLYAAEAGLGAHIPVVSRFRLNLEAVNLSLSDFRKGTYMKSSLRILPAYRVASHIELFGGPTLNYVNYTKESGSNLTDHYVWSKLGHDDFQGLFVGFTAGVQIIL